MKTFLISDTHFGHENIIRHCSRPYISSEEMDFKIIENINAVVGEDDVLYHLGDFSYRNKDTVEAYRNRIKCKTIHLCVGNHDKNAQYKTNLFSSIFMLKTFKLGSGKGPRIVFCHYPLESWQGSNHGYSFHFHGHCHGKSRKMINRLDVGVDCLNFKPILLDEAIDKSKTV